MGREGNQKKLHSNLGGGLKRGTDPPTCALSLICSAGGEEAIERGAKDRAREMKDIIAGQVRLPRLYSSTSVRGLRFEV